MRIYQRLRPAWEKGFIVILLEMDLQEAVEFWHSVCHATGTKGLVTAWCKELLSHDWRMGITHIYREGNMAVDCTVNCDIQMPVGCH